MSEWMTNQEAQFIFFHQPMKLAWGFTEISLEQHQQCPLLYIFLMYLAIFYDESDFS